jgi:mono/diheme cytochrome c family protein
MFERLSFTLVVLSVAFAVSLAQSSPATQAPDKNSDKNSEIARGKYLAEEVAKCTECHTPRDAQGQLKRDEWLQGAAIWITPVHPNSSWAERAPALAGLPSLTESQAERVLEQGVGPEGEALRPPMHIYHMTHADAKAIVAYLKSLPAAQEK